MFENPDGKLFLYVIIGAAIALALLWFLVIAPIEKRNHERKMALLQERIKNHQEKMGAGGVQTTDDGEDRAS